MRNDADASPRPGDDWLPWLVLLPALVLAWPGPNPIAGDFATTELSGTGVALLASLPLAGFLAWRRPRAPRALYLLLFVLLGLVVVPGGSDGLQRDRTWMVFTTGLLLYLGASALTPPGRGQLARGLALTSLLLTARALVEGTLLEGDGGLGGVLGNTGELSAAALPGALVGLHLWARAAGKARWLGAAAVLAFLVHAVLAPVLAGLLALSSVAALSELRRAGSRARPVFVSAAALALIALVVRMNPEWTRGPAPPEAAPSAAQTTTGGLEVRELIWRSTLDMIAEAPPTGVGAGQFAVAFPAYRDPAEIELSNWQRQVEATSEVENPHNDVLVVFAEGGLLVGALWLLFLLAVARAAWRGLAADCETPAALSAAALGVLAVALVGAPLTFDAPASVAAFACFGALFARATSAPTPRFQGAAGVGLFALALLSAPRAWSMWQLGLELIETTRTRSVTAQALAIDAALEHAPDSVVALGLAARIDEFHRHDLEAALDRWDSILVLRPLRFEALLNTGQLLARRGDLDEAWERFERALALDPGHPALLRNRVACAADRGRVDQALVELDRLEASGHLDPLWLRDLACDLLLRGMDREAIPLLERVDPRFRDLSGEEAYELSDELRRGGSKSAGDALRAYAHSVWAREQARDGFWDDARRSYRQNLRLTRERVQPKGPTRVRMEMAAVLWRSRMPEDARAMLADLEPDLADWAALPPWAGEVLLEMGFGVERE